MDVCVGVGVALVPLMVRLKEIDGDPDAVCDSVGDIDGVRIVNDADMLLVLE